MSPINDSLFRSSLRHVRRELKTLGFGTKKMLKTKASLTLLPSIMKQSYFTKDGKIYVPRWQSKKRNVRDMLRHEYGHALLFHYPQIKHSKGFQIFGHTNDHNDYVSDYAMTVPVEDFCETFMAYLKHKGKPPCHLSPRLKKKWAFISRLTKRFRSSS